jgi:hypothetical protein
MQKRTRRERNDFHVLANEKEEDEQDKERVKVIKSYEWQ